MSGQNYDYDYDYVIVGGGLQGGLIAMALGHHQPESRVLLIERDGRVAGNHTWSFHASDIPTDAWAWIDPIVEHRWDGYDVRVGSTGKAISLPYRSISSTHFARILEARFNAPAACDASGNSAIGSAPTRVISPSGTGSLIGGAAGRWELRTGTDVSEITPESVVTANGEQYRGRFIIDCRGVSSVGRVPFAQCGYQKFWGFELEFDEDWPLLQPRIMDDRVDQTDGFRFVYTLPFTTRRVLVEDTRFSNDSWLDRTECLSQVTEYLQRLGMARWTIVREERGVLPMPISGERMPGQGEGSVGGYAGGWFHAATGYSLPLAAAVAQAIASTTPEAAAAVLRQLAKEHRPRAMFARFLNRLLFCLVSPTTRYQVFERFYRVLSTTTIGDFYSHRFTTFEALRLLIGIPPRGLKPTAFARSFAAIPPFQRGFNSYNSQESQA